MVYPAALRGCVTFLQPKAKRFELDCLRPLLDVFSQDTTWPRASGAFFFSLPGAGNCAKSSLASAFLSGTELPDLPQRFAPHCVRHVTFPQPQGAPFALHRMRPLLDVFSQEQTWPRASGAFFFVSAG
jgi:hypothetical protein